MDCAGLMFYPHLGCSVLGTGITLGLRGVTLRHHASGTVANHSTTLESSLEKCQGKGKSFHRRDVGHMPRMSDVSHNPCANVPRPLLHASNVGRLLLSTGVASLREAHPSRLRGHTQRLAGRKSGPEPPVVAKPLGAFTSAEPLLHARNGREPSPLR
jgi:hypothetical protein